MELTTTTKTKEKTHIKNADKKGLNAPLKHRSEKMGKKLKRYKQVKSASRMTKNELEVTVKGLANSLNTYIKEGNRYGISENFKNFLDKSGYKKDIKVGKRTKNGVSTRTTGLTKDELIKKVGAYNKLLNEIEKSEKQWKQIQARAKEFNVSSVMMKKIFNYMHESAIEQYMDSDRIIKIMRSYKGDWTKFTKEEFAKIVDEFINKQAQQQKEVDLKTMFEEKKREQK